MGLSLNKIKNVKISPRQKKWSAISLLAVAFGAAAVYGANHIEDFKPAIGASEPGRASSSEHVKSDYFLNLQDIVVKTQDNRTLNVTAYAYCNTLDRLPFEEYKPRCREKIQEKLNIVAKAYEHFESAIPAESYKTRTHPGLPENYGPYPENYARFPKDMMQRAAEGLWYWDIYTVTNINQTAPKPASP